jgi:hypothetical protein
MWASVRFSPSIILISTSLAGSLLALTVDSRKPQLISNQINNLGPAFHYRREAYRMVQDRHLGGKYSRRILGSDRGQSANAFLPQLP